MLRRSIQLPSFGVQPFALPCVEGFLPFRSINVMITSDAAAHAAVASLLQPTAHMHVRLVRKQEHESILGLASKETVSRHSVRADACMNPEYISTGVVYHL